MCSWMAGVLDGDGCVYLGVLNRSRGRKYISPSVCLDNGDVDILNHFLYALRSLGINPHIRRSKDLLKIDVSKRSHLLKILPILAKFCRGLKAEKSARMLSILNSDSVDFDAVDKLRSIKNKPVTEKIEVSGINAVSPVTAEHLGWLGGLFDAEGNVFLGRHTKPSGQKYWAYSISFSNTDPAIIRSGIGIIKGMGVTPTCGIMGRKVKGRSPCYRVAIQNQEHICSFLEQMVSYLKSNKRKQAVALYKFLKEKSQSNFVIYKSTRTSTTLRDTPILTGEKSESEHL